MDPRQARYIEKRQQRRHTLSGAAAAAALSGRTRGIDIVNVTSLLKNADPLTRQGAVKNLAQMGGPQAIAAIARALYDANAEVRLACCKALGSMRAHGAKRQLLDTLNDTDPAVCCAAAESLAIMGNKAGLPHLARILYMPGPQRWRTLRSLNLLANTDFAIDEVGLAEAKRWLKRNRRWFSR